MRSKLKKQGSLGLGSIGQMLFEPQAAPRKLANDCGQDENRNPPRVALEPDSQGDDKGDWQMNVEEPFEGKFALSLAEISKRDIGEEAEEYYG